MILVGITGGMHTGCEVPARASRHFQSHQSTPVPLWGLPLHLPHQSFPTNSTLTKRPYLRALLFQCFGAGAFPGGTSAGAWAFWRFSSAASLADDSTTMEMRRFCGSLGSSPSTGMVSA